MLKQSTQRTLYTDRADAICSFNCFHQTYSATHDIRLQFWCCKMFVTKNLSENV